MLFTATILTATTKGHSSASPPQKTPQVNPGQPAASRAVDTAKAADCVKVIHAADAALKAERDYNLALRDQLKLAEEQRKDDAEAREKAEDRLNAWYRNPLTLVLSGVILGVVGIGRISK